MDTHAGRIAVVTGAAGGFGQAISCELARRGADIIAIDLNPADDTVSAVQEVAGLHRMEAHPGNQHRLPVPDGEGRHDRQLPFPVVLGHEGTGIVESLGGNAGQPGRGTRVVAEAAGVLSAFGEGVDLAGHNGAYLLIGLWSGHGTTPVDPTVLVHKNLRIIGSCFAQPEHYYRAMHLAAQLEQRLPLTEIITHRKTPSPRAT